MKQLRKLKGNFDRDKTPIMYFFSLAHEKACLDIALYSNKRVYPGTEYCYSHKTMSCGQVDDIGS